MDLKTYIADPDRRAALAEKLKTSPQYLYQVASNWRGRKASPALAQDIERVTGELGPEPVPKESLRPDIWPPAPALEIDQPVERAA
jgi:DNA-binding transcriptional regulator YdaS (Cro superfamily)